MFTHCTKLASVDDGCGGIDRIYYNYASSLGSMFYNDSNLTYISNDFYLPWRRYNSNDIKKSARNMQYYCYVCNKLTTVPSGVTLCANNSNNINRAFINCTKLETLPNIRLSTDATDFTATFSGCSNLMLNIEDIIPAEWANFDKTINLNSTFNGCAKISRNCSSR